MIIAGVYGALHDQISFTVSSEYFTKFKYIQFRLVESGMADRSKAGLIGFLATWWMGIPIGLFVGGFGFLHKTPKDMFIKSLKSLLIVTIIALLVGVTGLMYGWFFASHKVSDYSRWFIPENLIAPKNYLSVGYMHNFSYIGGLLGLVAGVIYQFKLRVKVNSTNKIE